MLFLLIPQFSPIVLVNCGINKNNYGINFLKKYKVIIQELINLIRTWYIYGYAFYMCTEHLLLSKRT